MAAGTQKQDPGGPESEPVERPELSVCESARGKRVFLETGNDDGWIATDTTTEVTR